tara:strand:- start:16419 stop:18368 length:1950 start_codon:yes stop_codon:yes gene_type:complete
MEEGLDLNIQDGSKHDKYISYWLYYYTYLNTLGRGDKRKQTMSVLFDDETDSPQRLEDTINYLEPILHNVRLITSGKSDRVDWTGDKLPINNIQKYKLSNKRKMKDWLCFPAIANTNTPYLQRKRLTEMLHEEYYSYANTSYALGRMLKDYFSISEKDLQDIKARRKFLHPSTKGNWRAYHRGLNQNILSQKKTISSSFLEVHKYRILATQPYESPNSGVARCHDSFSKYFTLNSFLDFFKPEVYQGGNLDEVDSEYATAKLKQAKQLVKSMRKQLREINNQVEEHENNIREMVQETNWIKDGRRLKAQSRQINEIIEAIYFLDEQMYEKIKIMSEKYIATVTRILKKLGHSEKQIYRILYSSWKHERLQLRLSHFLYLKNMSDSDIKYGNVRLIEYKHRNKNLAKYLTDVKRLGLDYVDRHYEEPPKFSYWANIREVNSNIPITQYFQKSIQEVTHRLLNKIIPCKSILVNEGRTKLPSATTLYSKSDAYVSLKGLKKYANLRIAGHKYYKVFQGGWESYMKSLTEVKDYDRILITPLIVYKSHYDLGRSIIFIPAGMKAISNVDRKPLALKYVRSYYQTDLEAVVFSNQGVRDMQRQLESIYNKIMSKTKNPFTKKKRLTEREDRMMDWSILEIRLNANEDLGFLNW